MANVWGQAPGRPSRIHIATYSGMITIFHNIKKYQCAGGVIMNKYIQVATTFEKYEEAKKVAEQLVAARLTACVQIVPNCHSVYRWQGKVESAHEIVCTMKSRLDLFPRLCEAIGAMHSYEVPEIIATEIIDASPDYLQWLERELLPTQDD